MIPPHARRVTGDVRGLAERDDDDGVTTALTDTRATAVASMREHAVRRIFVVDKDKLVGVLSLGDAAVEQDPNSALGQISAAPENS
jgi:CBS domain-containing protein